MKILGEAIKEDDELGEFLKNKNKICIQLATIYAWMLRRSGIEDVEQLYGDVFVGIEQGKITVNVAKALLSAKIMTKAEGFGEEDQLDRTKQADIELGFIDEEYNETNVFEIKKQIPKEESVQKKLEKFLQLGSKYIESVIGRKLKNVEFHKYYRILLESIFPTENIRIFPLHTQSFDDIKYVIIGKENNEFYYYILKDGSFFKTSEEELRKIKESGYSIPNKYEIEI